MKLGYFLSCEEWGPKELVELAVKAESAGFEGLWISDHFHPWNDEQGHSPFVWSVIGAIAQATERMTVTTAVTCPTLRIHPALVAQAAATSAIQLDGRFCLGVGSGEALNEHILADRWPGADERLEMLEEAVHLIRKLWQGGVQDHRGRHYRVENCRIYDLPALPPPIFMSGFGPKAIDLAGRISDGFITVAPDPDAVEASFGELDLSNMSALQDMFGNPETLLGAVQTPEQQEVRARIDVLLTAIVGYVDHVLETVGRNLIGTYDRLMEAVRRRRAEATDGERFAARLLGLEVGRPQYERGTAFARGVVERAGPAGLNRLWDSAELLPTTAELDAPGLWLARI